MQSEAEKLVRRHARLVQTDMLKVESHVQRHAGEWVINTIMVAGYTVPFRYKRKQRYKSLQGQRVNLTYYPDTEIIAGIEFEIMKVVRIKVA